MCAYAFTESKVHCGSALGPGASGLPCYCTPPATVPAVLGGLAVWRHNNNQKKCPAGPKGRFKWNSARSRFCQCQQIRYTITVTICICVCVWMERGKERRETAGKSQSHKELRGPSGSTPKGVYFEPRVGGEVRICGFYNNKQTNKQWLRWSLRIRKQDTREDIEGNMFHS